MKIAGMILILAGVAAFLCGGFSYTSNKKVVDMGPMQMSVAENHSVPIPPILGIAAVLAGGALVYLGMKKA